MKVIVNNGFEKVVIGEALVSNSLTLAQAIYIACGYDIEDAEDCERAYNDGVEGFYCDDCGSYAFDIEAAEMVY